RRDTPTVNSTVNPPDPLAALREDRVLSMVRAPHVDDVAALSAALVTGGIRVIELTFTIAELPRLLRTAGEAAPDTGAVVGAGTVRTAAQAGEAIAAGARFVVTPGMGPDAADIVRLAHASDAGVILGAFSPSEVITAAELGADMVKIFPARACGPKYLSDLQGPLPEVPLVPSGGIDNGNAADYLDAGALAVTAGTSVVAPADVVERRWADITAKAAAFCTDARP